MHGEALDFIPVVDVQTDDVVEVRSATPEAAAKLAYRLSALGEPTPFWVTLSVASWGQGRDTSCEFYTGDPSAGGVLTDSGPFTCEVNWEWRDQFHVQYFYDIELNQVAEASGTFTTQDVALTGGTFRTNAPDSTTGATELAPGQSTGFNAVMVKGDPFKEYQVRAEFSYEIVDEGTPTGLWVAGVSHNEKGSDLSAAEAHCGIYDGDPLRGDGRLDGTHPIESDAYICKTTSGFVNGPGRVDGDHYHADFTLAKR